ncbi:hypothetical protein WA577_007713, partial [Blastocystis sp. JDR]
MTVIFSKWIPSSRNESLLPYAIFGCNNMESTIVECQTKQSPLEKRVSSLKIMNRYKCVLLGDAGAGKTSIITRFMYDSYDPIYQSTIGIDFLSKTISIGDRPVRLQLWDTAGQERFRSLIPSYIRDSSMAIIVYDISSERSFGNVHLWYDDVKQQRDDIEVVIVGNKSDLEGKRVIPTERGQTLAKELGCQFVETSAKCGTNVDTIFKELLTRLPTRPAHLLDDGQKCLEQEADVKSRYSGKGG